MSHQTYGLIVQSCQSFLDSPGNILAKTAFREPKDRNGLETKMPIPLERRLYSQDSVHRFHTNKHGNNVWHADQTTVKNCCRLVPLPRGIYRRSRRDIWAMATNISSDMIMPSMDDVDAQDLPHRRFKSLLPLSQDYAEDGEIVQIALGGHRGFGANVWSSEGPEKSYRYRENTISSFLAAVDAGATFIEFDVQVTSDGVAVLFHDNFLVYGDEANPESKLIKDMDLKSFKGASPVNSVVDGHSGSILLDGMSDDEVMSAPPPSAAWPMLGEKSLSTVQILEEEEFSTVVGDSPRSIVTNEGIAEKKLLRQLKNGIAASASEKSLSAWRVDEEDDLPTLLEVFERIPAHVGFDIEIKMATEDDLVETHEEEIVRVVDTILSTIQTVENRILLEGFPKRPLIFSSFDPDVCSLVKKRRPSDTVMFLSTGGTSWHADPRRMSLQAAIEFAASNHLQGIIVDSGSLFNDKDTVSRAKERGLVTMTYGLENDNPQWVAHQSQIHVHGVIVDDVARMSKYFLSS